MSRSPLCVRGAEARDAAAFDDVLRRSFEAAQDESASGVRPQAPSAASWGARMARGPRRDRRFWVAEQDGCIVGVAATAPTQDRDDDPTRTSELVLLYVAPESWGRGAGSALLAQALADVQQRGWRELSLWVFEANARARRFYERAGLAPDGGCVEVERGGVRLLTRRYRLVLG